MLLTSCMYVHIQVTRNDAEFLELVGELLADSVASDMDREGMHIE
jgi:hypothetical protein